MFKTDMKEMEKSLGEKSLRRVVEFLYMYTKGALRFQ